MSRSDVDRVENHGCSRWRLGRVHCATLVVHTAQHTRSCAQRGICMLAELPTWIDSAQCRWRSGGRRIRRAGWRVVQHGRMSVAIARVAIPSVPGRWQRFQPKALTSYVACCPAARCDLLQAAERSFRFTKGSPQLSWGLCSRSSRNVAAPARDRATRSGLRGAPR